LIRECCNGFRRNEFFAEMSFGDVEGARPDGAPGYGEYPAADARTILLTRIKGWTSLPSEQHLL
jgi:hypothetical protein